MPSEANPLFQPLSVWLEQFNRWLPALVSAVLILIASLVLASLARRAVRLATSRRQVSLQIAPLLASLAYWSIALTGFTVALQQLGINVTAIVAGLGIVGFTLGFALQDVSKNFVSGVLLLLEKPFRIGDAVEVSGYSGTVTAVDLRATELRTLDGRLVMIPNAEVFTKPITNLTRTGSRRIELKLGVAYTSDLEKVRSVALSALSDIPGLLSTPAPTVFFQELSSTINLAVFYWIDTSQSDPLSGRDRGLVNLYAAFQAAGIEIPPPMQTVQLIPPGEKS